MGSPRPERSIVKILILDDDVKRHNWYDRVYRQHEVFHAYSYTTFVTLLHTASPWDLVMLDYDLGDHHVPDTYVDSHGFTTQYTGQDAAGVLCRLSDEELPQNVIVHSMNPYGARRIMRDLDLRGVNYSQEPYDPVEFQREVEIMNRYYAQDLLEDI